MVWASNEKLNKLNATMGGLDLDEKIQEEKIKKGKKAKMKEGHEADVREYLENHPDRDMSKIVIHKVYKKNDRWWFQLICDGKNREKQQHIFEMQKGNIIRGNWCKECYILNRKITPLQVEIEIREYLKNHPKRDMNKITIRGAYQKNGYWYIKLICDGKNPETKQHNIEMRKDVIKRGDWCKQCDVMNRTRNPEQVEEGIREYLENHPDRDMSKIKIHKVYMAEYGKKGKKEWRITLTCDGKNPKNENHKFDMRESHIKNNKWCNECFELNYYKTYEQVESEIRDYLEKNPERKMSKIKIHEVYNKNGFWRIKLSCDGKNRKNKHHEIDITYNHIKYGKWCKQCDIMNRTRTPKIVVAKIRKYLENHPERDTSKIMIHKVYRKERTQKGEKRKTWYLTITCEGVMIEGKIEKHTFEIREDGIMQGNWCSICQDRIIAIGKLSHVIVEYYSLKLLIELRKCNAKHEATIEEGTRPDLIIQWNDVFNKEIASRLDIFSFLESTLSNINEIAVDFTMSRKFKFITEKGKRNYQNIHRALLIVLMYADENGGVFTAEECQEKIEGDSEIKNKELIKIINYEQYLTLLGLSKEVAEMGRLTDEEIEFRNLFLNIKNLALTAIQSSEAMYELIGWSLQCKEKLKNEFK